MESQDELYSFLGDRVGRFHNSVVRRGRRVAVGRLYLFFLFFLQTIFLIRQVNAQFHSHFKITEISFYERFVKIKQ